MTDQPQEEKTPGTAMETLPTPSDAYLEAAEAKSLAFMNPKRWQVMNVMAQTFLQSGALPATIKNAPQLIMVMQAGYEAGLQPLESMNAFYFVNGRLSMFGDTAISQVLKAGHDVEWGNCNAESATVKITRGDNGKSMSSTYTMAQAKARGLTGKDPWVKFPENMLKFKAFHMTAKFICPDALHGVPIKEDIEGGDVIDQDGQPVDTKGRGKAKKVTVETAADAPEHKPLDQALKEPTEADVNIEDVPAKDGETPASKSMKRGMKKAGVDPDEAVLPPKRDPFALTGDPKKDKVMHDALIQDEIDGRVLDAAQKKFITAYNAKYATK